MLSSLAVAAELTAGTLRPVPVSALNLNRALRAVWPAGRRLTGPARDLYTIAARSARQAQPDKPPRAKPPPRTTAEPEPAPRHSPQPSP